jgi:hypothetical protein
MDTPQTLRYPYERRMVHLDHVRVSFHLVYNLECPVSSSCIHHRYLYLKCYHTIREPITELPFQNYAHKNPVGATTPAIPATTVSFSPLVPDRSKTCSNTSLATPNHVTTTLTLTPPLSTPPTTNHLSPGPPNAAPRTWFNPVRVELIILNVDTSLPLIGEKIAMLSPSGWTSFRFVAKRRGSGSVTSKSSAARRGTGEGASLGVAESGVGEARVVSDERVEAGGSKGKVDMDARHFEGVERVCAESLLMSSSITYSIPSALCVSRDLWTIAGDIPCTWMCLGPAPGLLALISPASAHSPLSFFPNLMMRSAPRSGTSNSYPCGKI